jgi:hypothetical protein
MPSHKRHGHRGGGQPPQPDVANEVIEIPPGQEGRQKGLNISELKEMSIPPCKRARSPASTSPT